jgi:hypothetical protein
VAYLEQNGIRRWTGRLKREHCELIVGNEEEWKDNAPATAVGEVLPSLNKLLALVSAPTTRHAPLLLFFLAVLLPRRPLRLPQLLLAQPTFQLIDESCRVCTAQTNMRIRRSARSNEGRVSVRRFGDGVEADLVGELERDDWVRCKEFFGDGVTDAEEREVPTCSGRKRGQCVRDGGGNGRRRRKTYKRELDAEKTSSLEARR